MTRSILMITLSLLVFSCNRKQPDISLPTSAPINIPSQNDSAVTFMDTHFYWIAEIDQKNGLAIKRLLPIKEDSMSVQVMISKLNHQYPEIQLKYKYQSNDTLFLKINKSSYLTEQMGTTGAEAYLATITFNLTELDGISAVDISFKMGDHAEPGVYTRTDFIHEVNN